MTAASAVPFIPSAVRADAGELYAAALREPDGSYAAAFFSPETGIVAKTALPGRGHSCLLRPGASDCIVFARRPGTFAVAFGAEGHAAPSVFTASPGRHFYGHGAFSPDGRLLYSTENDYENARGVIGVRDVGADYRSIGEFDSGGIGPHDMAVMPDRRTLVIANGGIETHPDHGRAPLNLETMAPNLAYVDARTGDVLERHELSRHLHRVSIRHLAVCADGAVVFGCQHKGAKNIRPTLVGFHRRGEGLMFAELPQDANARLRGYVASVAVDGSGEIAAATSPRGGVALYFDTGTGKYVGLNAFADASGVAGRRKKTGFVLTSGSGRIARSEGKRIFPLGTHELAWDNHVTSIC